MFDNIHGIQYSTVNKLGVRSSSYVSSENVVINEVITTVRLTDLR